MWDTPPQRDDSMRGFAGALASLVTDHGVTNLRWATVQNEPNTTRITWSDKRLKEWRAFKKLHPTAGKPPPGTAAQDGVFDFSRYEDLYRRLGQHLEKNGVDAQIKLMAGDLTQANQDVWFEHLAQSETLSSIVHGYSVHIYWDYWNTPKINARLKSVQKLAAHLNAPLFVTEYGVRGKRRIPNLVDPGVFEDGSEDGSPVGQSTVAGFQYAWFNILAARMGYRGTAQWDCFQGKYDKNGTLTYYAIGPHETDQEAERWHPFPSYFLLQLLTMTIDPRWQVVTMHPLNPAQSNKLLAGFAKDAGLSDLTVLGLDTRGKLTDDATPESYTISGLPHGRSFTPVIWNGGGRGDLVREDPIASTGGSCDADRPAEPSSPSPPRTSRSDRPPRISRRRATALACCQPVIESWSSYQVSRLGGAKSLSAL